MDQNIGPDPNEKPDPPTPTPTRAFTDLFREAKERFMLAETAEAQNRRYALDDLAFKTPRDNGPGQWPDYIRTARTRDQRPCITINRLPQFVKQKTNEMRQARPGIKVNPVDSGADLETAEVLQGIIRHIEVQSKADIAYDTAAEFAVSMGWGYWRILTKYVDDLSFEQEIFIDRIMNPFMVYFDPSCQQPDYSDANWAFICQDYTRAEYKALYPDSALATLSDFRSVGDQNPGWLGTDSVRVAEYFNIERERKVSVQLATGGVQFKDDLPDGFDESLITQEREVDVPIVHWHKFNAVEELDKPTILPGRWIPIVPMLGDENNVNGTRILSGMIRYSKEAQQLFNIWVSAKTEMIALAPKAPYIMAEGQNENHEEEWRTANVRNYPALYYKPIALNGQPLPPPQRQTYEPPIQAIVQAELQASDYLKETTGYYDASLGAGTADTSGKAINARKMQGSIANLNYSDNQARALRHTGNIIVNWIPKIYDARQVARIIGIDGQAQTVQLNPDQEQAHTVSEDGVKSVYNLGVGRYDVTVSSGPSYETQRQENAELLSTIVQQAPSLVPVVGDLLFKYLDEPVAQEISKRLKKSLPPNLQDDTDNPVPPKAQAQMAQMDQMIKQLTDQLNTATETINTKQVETSSNERIAAMNAEVQKAKIEADLIKAQADSNITAFEADMARIQQQIDHLHEQAMAQQQLAAQPTDSAQPVQ